MVRGLSRGPKFDPRWQCWKQKEINEKWYQNTHSNTKYLHRIKYNVRIGKCRENSLMNQIRLHEKWS
jgi:hypothetical protein